MRAGRSIPATLLLVAVTAGLFAMHTLGHAGMSSGMTVHDSSALVEPAHMAAAATRTLAVVAMGPGAPSDQRMPMGVLALCLAVLGGVTLVAMISLLARLQHSWSRWPGGPRGSFAIFVRGPPLGQGLILADLSVRRN